MALSPEKDLVRGMRFAFDSSKYTDLILRCHGQDFKVHRIILCTRSSFFEKACEDDFKEAEEGIINLVDDDLQVVERMLEFFYTLDYQDGPKIPEGSTHNLATHASVYSIAEKYEIMPLKALAKQKFEEMIKGHWNDPSLPVAIEIIYNTTHNTDRGLRTILTTSIKGQVNILLQKPQFADVVRLCGDFAVDLMNAVCSVNVNSPSKKLLDYVAQRNDCWMCSTRFLIKCCECSKIWLDSEGRWISSGGSVKQLPQIRQSVWRGNGSYQPEDEFHQCADSAVVLCPTCLHTVET